MKNIIIIFSLLFICVFTVSFAAPRNKESSSRDKRTINLFVNSFLDAFTNTLNQRTASQAEAAAARAVQAAQAARATANASQRPNNNNIQGNAFGIGFGATLPRLGIFPLIIPSIANPAPPALPAPPAMPPAGQAPAQPNGPARVNIPLAMPASSSSSSPAPTTLPPPPPPPETTLPPPPPPPPPTTVPANVPPTTIPAGSDGGQTLTGDDGSNDYESSSTEVEDDNDDNDDNNDDDDDADDNSLSSRSDFNSKSNEKSSTSDNDHFDSKFWRTTPLPPAWFKNDNYYSELTNTPRSAFYTQQLERIKSYQPNRKNHHQSISHVRPTTYYDYKPETYFSGANGYNSNEHLQPSAPMLPSASHSRVKMHDHGYDHFTFHDNHQQTQPNAYRSEYFGKHNWD